MARHLARLNPAHADRSPTPRAGYILAGVLLLGSLACGDSTGPDSTGPEMDRLREQRALWEAQDLADYTYDVRRVCFCPFREGVRITVLNNVVAGAVDLATGEVLGPAELQWYETIDGLFDLLQSAYDQNAHEVQVEFDPGRGYPTRIFIDYSEMIADEELGFTLLSDVQALGG